MKPTLLKQLMSGSYANPIISGVCVDTRLLEVGNLYFALPGTKVDGHQYLAEAAAKGAAAAVVRKGYEGMHENLPLIAVDDVLQSLQELAKKFLNAQHPKTVIAVTGSMGKTTTKDFLSTLLGGKYKLSSSPGNSNSQIGMPLAILNHMDEEAEVLILEMGMTHPGNIRRLIEIAPPDIALITTLGLVHACNFDSIEQIAAAKAEIFEHPLTQCGIYHHEICNREKVKQSGSCRKLTFSTSSNDADYFLEKMVSTLSISESQSKNVLLPLLPVPGEHNNHNFLAAVSAARALDVSWEEILARQPLLKLPERRLQFIEKNGVLFINDSYNASEMAVKAALRTMPEPKNGGRKIALLGSLLELGKFSEQCHWDVGEYALNYVDWMLCLGPECAPIHQCWKQAGKPVFWDHERSALVAALRAQLQPGDVVLLKGSRLKQLWKILEEL